MTVSVDDGESRSIELETTVHARPDAVWRALTDGGELVRWFPPEARVTPGPGGAIWMSWGEGSQGEARIDVWEPNRHLGLREEWPGADGKVVRMAVDWHLRAAGGGATVVRVVQSGFGAGADDQMSATRGGWTFFLHHLRLSLERHAGTPRDLVWERRKTGLARDQAWAAVLGPRGMRSARAPGELKPGDAVTLDLGDAGRLEGTVVLVNPGFQLALDLPGLDDGLLLIEAEGGKAGTVGIWLSTFGLPRDRVEALRTAVSALADRLFPAPAPAAEAAT